MGGVGKGLLSAGPAHRLRLSAAFVALRPGMTHFLPGVHWTLDSRLTGTAATQRLIAGVGPEQATSHRKDDGEQQLSVIMLVAKFIFQIKNKLTMIKRIVFRGSKDRS